MEARSHKDLVVWQKSIQLSLLTYKVTQYFPQREIYGLSSQMRRASVSIPSNIAEGRNRGASKDYTHFLDMAYGSVAELETQLHLAISLNFVDPTRAEEISALLTEVAKMLHVMINKLREDARS